MNDISNTYKVIDIKVTSLKQFSKNNNISFFILSLFGLLNVVNRIGEFKYRILEDKVILYDKIRTSCTIARPDMTFGFGYFDHIKDFKIFEQEAKKIIRTVENERTVDGKLDELDMVHSSVIPWISFSSVEHSKSQNLKDSIPKIVFGKLFEQADDIFMPVSVSGHHSLMDASHVGVFMELYTKLCSNPEKLLTHNSI